MNNFEIKTKIKFGEESLDTLKDIKNKMVLIITDPFMVKSKVVDNITVNLNDCTYEIFSGIVPDPSIEVIVKGIEVFDKIKPEVVIALGGGSAIDVAKAIVDFSKKIFKVNEVIFIAIPTTSGTGSEVTSFSVITDNEKGIKYPLISDSLLPNMAILDPKLVKTVPSEITADTGMDVLTHAIEAYVSTNANDFSDALSEKAIKLVFEYLPKAYKNGEDLEAREKMHNASCLAGMAFNQVSLGINHSISHALGGKFHIPHGRINSILLTHVIEYNSDLVRNTNLSYSKIAKKYAQISSLLGMSFSNISMGIRMLIDEILKLQKELNMVTKLSQCNVNEYDIRKEEYEISKLAIQDRCTKTNPKIPTEKDIKEILNKII